MTGQGAAMGIKTGNVLVYATKCKFCRVCDTARKKRKQPANHDCRNNHTGSSKAMEPAVASEMWNSAPMENIKFSVYIGDDDTTTLSISTKMYRMVWKSGPILSTLQDISHQGCTIFQLAVNLKTRPI